MKANKMAKKRIQTIQRQWFFLLIILALTDASQGIVATDSSVIAADVLPFIRPRKLQNSRWGALNKIFDNAIIHLPDSSMKHAGLTLKVRNLSCTNIQVQDITLEAQRISPQQVVIATTVLGLDMVCNADYEFHGWLFARKSGNVYVESSGNQAAVQTVFDSLDYSQYPPYDSSVTGCSPTINLNKLDFSNGGLLGWTLDKFQGRFRGKFESMAEDRFCEELRRMSSENMGTLLNEMENRLVQYPFNIHIDPLESEHVLQQAMRHESPTKHLINWQAPDTYPFGFWMDHVWNETVSFLNKEVKRPNGSMVKNANLLLSEHVLGDNGALVVDIGKQEDRVIYQGQDQWTQTRMIIDQIQIEGLDTLVTLDPLEDIGNYTLGSRLSWQELAVKMDVTIEIQPSASPDSYITGNYAGDGITERVTIHFSMSQVAAEISILLALDQDEVDDLQVGHFLNKDNILPCLLSSVYQVELASLAVEAIDLEPPQLSGFVSAGLDNVISNAVHGAFLMYEASLLRASRAYFQTTVRGVINKGIRAHEKSYGNATCVMWELPTPPAVVDFRDLLLYPEDSILVGGSGTGRYGNLFSEFVMPTLKEQVFTHGKINSRFIRPFTLRQSGEEGNLVWDAPFFEFVQDSNGNHTDMSYGFSDLGWSRFMVKAYDATVDNVDTVLSPLNLLIPQDKTKLSNTVRMGRGNDTENVTQPLTFSSRLVFAGEAKDGTEDLQNELKLSLSIPSSMLAFDVVTAMNESSLIHFPLKDLSNRYCWLAAISRQSAITSSLDLAGVVFSLVPFFFDVTCVSCISPGFNVIPDIFGMVQEAGFFASLLPSMEQALTEFTNGFWDNMNVGTMLSDAPRLCPHNQAFDEAAVAKNIYGFRHGIRAYPQWSRHSVAMVVSMGYVALYTMMIAFAENHLSRLSDWAVIGNSEVMDQTLLANRSLRLLDWTNLSATVGPWADEALSEIDQYLNSRNIDEVPGLSNRYMEGISQHILNQGVPRTQDIRANVLIREFFLDKHGVFSFPLYDIRFSISGLAFSVPEVQIKGLDSVVNINVLRVGGPQLLQHEITFDYLNVSVVLEVQSGLVSDNYTLTYPLHNVTTNLSQFVAIDLDKLGQTKLESLLRISRIIPCLLPAAYAISISELNVKVGEADKLLLDGPFSPELELGLSAVQDSLFVSYSEDILSAIPEIFNSTVKRLLNGKIKEVIRQPKLTQCQLNPGGGFIDFRDLLLSQSAAIELGANGGMPYGDLFEVLHGIVNHELSGEGAGGELAINSFVASWTTEQSTTSGVLEFTGKIFDTNTSINFGGLHATLGLALNDVTIDNVDSLSKPLSLLDPTGPYDLNNTVTFGMGPDPVHFAARIIFSLEDNEDIQIRNEIDVLVSIHAVSFFVTILFKIRESAFFRFPLRDIPNVYCWLATAFAPTGSPSSGHERGIGLADHAMFLESLTFNATCVSCTSPRFDDLINDLYGPSETKKPKETIEEIFSQVLNGDAIQTFLDRVVLESSKRCPHSAEYIAGAGRPVDLLENPIEPFSFSGFSKRNKRSKYFNIASSIFAALLLCFLLAGKWRVFRRNKKWKESLTEKGLSLLRRQKAKEDEQETILNLYSTSLFRNPQISEKVRLAVPTIIAANIVLYLGGHLGVLSTVDIDGQLAGQDFAVRRMLKFSFLGSTAETYRNGGMEMSIMIWIFTGIWPYLKLLLSLFIWFAPPHVLSVSKRGRLLLWIDALTKLSIIDIFTMLLSLALFLVYIGGPDEALSSSDLYAMKLIVVPGASFYCLVVAQRISRVSSRFFLETHDVALRNARKAYERGDITEIYQGRTAESDGADGPDSTVNGPEQVSVGEVNKRNDDDDEISSFVGEVNKRNDDDDEISSSPNMSVQRRSLSFMQLKSLSGHIGVLLGALTVLVLGIIGCIFAPSVAIEISDLWGLVLGSDATYFQAISNYGVFSIVTAILVKSRFVLDTTWNYVALGFLLTIGIVSVGGVFLLDFFRFFRRLRKEGWSFIRTRSSLAHQLPSYLRLHAYRHMEIYVIAAVIGCWQLSAVSIYCIHLFCSIADFIYKLFSYIGLAERPTAECFPIQMAQPGNLLIFLGSFGILVGNFCLQSSTQYRKNMKEASELLQHTGPDVEQLSALWNPNSLANVKDGDSSRELQLNDTASFSEDNSVIAEIESSVSADSFAAARLIAPYYASIMSGTADGNKNFR